ncbi:MAG: hypothetical protein IKH23_02230 [Clostridiales bacterium]|jgi:hypothetical protein|nr:hypothetical protein [Clostridiales bacterium]
MSLGRVRQPIRKAEYGTTEQDVEKRRAKIYIICALILLVCGVLDVLFIVGILGL